jgi:FkbM family methyltransferase
MSVIKLPHRVIRTLKNIKRKLRTAFNIPIEYSYGTFSISLPPDHMLPEYQRSHPNYDRFLPHLVKHLNDSDIVIDIGANVGDTLAAMYQANRNLRYICIEPDDVFFKHLSDNIERIRSAGHKIDVAAIKALVGKSVSALSLEGKGGTKHAVVGANGGIRSEPLDKLIDQSSIGSVRLLKTDVDGFDWDVIDSSTTVIQSSKPLIYFELQYDNVSQYNGYLNTIDELYKNGYTDWFVFDNYGSLMLKADKLETLKQLMLYVLKQNISKSTRTIFYFDVLAVQKNDAAFVDNLLKTY